MLASVLGRPRAAEGRTGKDGGGEGAWAPGREREAGERGGSEIPGGSERGEPRILIEGTGAEAASSSAASRGSAGTRRTAPAPVLPLRALAASRSGPLRPRCPLTCRLLPAVLCRPALPAASSRTLPKVNKGQTLLVWTDPPRLESAGIGDATLVPSPPIRLEFSVLPAPKPPSLSPLTQGTDVGLQNKPGGAGERGGWWMGWERALLLSNSWSKWDPGII